MERRSFAGVLLCCALLASCEEELPETAPSQISSSPFQYPEELWDAGAEGETVLRIFVNAQGGVDTVRVDSASEYPAFDSSAVKGAWELRFDPARRGEEPVGVWVLLPVQFDLSGSSTVPAPDSAAAAADTVVAAPAP